MQTPSVWEQVLIGIVVVLVLLWISPGIKTAFKQRREASQADWMAVLIPIALVALFVTLLIALT